MPDDATNNAQFRCEIELIASGVAAARLPVVDCVIRSGTSGGKAKAKREREELPRRSTSELPAFAPDDAHHAAWCAVIEYVRSSESRTTITEDVIRDVARKAGQRARDLWDEGGFTFRGGRRRGWTRRGARQLATERASLVPDGSGVNDDGEDDADGLNPKVQARKTIEAARGAVGEYGSLLSDEILSDSKRSRAGGREAASDLIGYLWIAPLLRRYLTPDAPTWSAMLQERRRAKHEIKEVAQRFGGGRRGALAFGNVVREMVRAGLTLAWPDGKTHPEIRVPPLSRWAAPRGMWSDPRNRWRRVFLPTVLAWLGAPRWVNFALPVKPRPIWSMAADGTELIEPWRCSHSVAKAPDIRGEVRTVVDAESVRRAPPLSVENYS